MACPPWDVLPYDGARPSARALGRRMALLRRLAEPGAAPRIVVVPAAALLQRMAPPGVARGFRVAVGEPLDEAALMAFCEGADYRADERVDEAGEVAMRGEV